MPHLFEFMDVSWVPKSLRDTLREGVEMVCSPPIRQYDPWVAELVRQMALTEHCCNIVELGAGTAPVTRILASKLPDEDSVRLIPCDVNPDAEGYRELESRFPGRVTPVYDPVDITQPREWPPDTLLFLSGTMHHIPPRRRLQVIESLAKSGDQVLIFEPLRKTLFALVAVSFDWLPALLVPIWFLNRPGRIRRFLWSWGLPVAPAMFTWDAFVSTLRQWTATEWREQLEKLGLENVATIEQGVLRLAVTFPGRVFFRRAST